MVYRGFVRGEMSPPTAISIVSLSGGTHPAMDAVSVQSLVSVSFSPRSDGVTMQADRGQHCGGQCDIFATIRSERRSLRPCPDLVSFLTTTNQKSGGVSARGNRDSDGPFSRSLVRQRFCENAYLGTVDSGSEKFPGRRRARPTARPGYGAVAWAAMGWRVLNSVGKLIGIGLFSA